MPRRELIFEELYFETSTSEYKGFILTPISIFFLTHNFLYLLICVIELKVICCEHFIMSLNSESLNAGE